MQQGGTVICPEVNGVCYNAGAASDPGYGCECKLGNYATARTAPGSWLVE